MLAAVATSPPAAPPAIAVIDERWAAPPVPTLKAAMVDPRVSQAAAAVIAEAAASEPPPDPAPNRQPGLQPVVYGADAAAVEKFARRFSEAKVPPCLAPSSGGLGLFAIPVIAVQALRGKCL